LFESLSITSLEYTSNGRSLIIALRDGSINLVDLNGNIKAVQKNTFHKAAITKIITAGNNVQDAIFMTLSSDLIVLWSEVTLGKLTKMPIP